METVPALPQMLAGTTELRHRRGGGFPTEELVCNGAVVAELGRNSAFWIFFGRGRRVRLADGTEWRIKSTTSARHIVPIIRSEAGMIAISGPLKAKRSYGINGKDYGYTLIPLGPIGIRRPAQWSLRRRQSEIAVIDDRDRIVRTDEPIQIAAVLMAFTLITHGIPGEANLIPQRD